MPKNAQNREQVSMTPPHRWLKPTSASLREGLVEVLGQQSVGRGALLVGG
ncbi:hypothetical protein [Nocardioides convexus]|nr:hypothetical protein [Nocardioides convexus]